MAQQTGGVVKIGQIHFGGIALSKFEGRANTVAELVGVDIHSKPGVISANQQMKKDSGSTVTEAIGASCNCTDGNSYFFSRDSGKVWKRTGAGVWSLAYTLVAGVTPYFASPNKNIQGRAYIAYPSVAGTQNIRGVANIKAPISRSITGKAYIGTYPVGAMSAMEFEGYIYWTTQNDLHRISVTGTSDWATNAAPYYASFNNRDANFHPMIIIDSRLYIGDGSSVHQLYQGSLAIDALRVLSHQHVTCLGKYDYDLLVGTMVDNYLNKSTLYRWNRWSNSWNYEDDIEEVGINAILPMDNGVAIQAGLIGNLYAYSGGQLELLQQIPGDYTATTQTKVFYGAVGNMNGMPLFVPSNVNGNPCKQGVYSLFSKFPLIYPKVLNFEYMLSPAVVAGLEVQNILVRGTTVFVCWKSGITYGVDTIDTANKYNGAYLASKVIYGDPRLSSIMASVIIPYVELPDNTSISVYCKKNFSTSWGSALTTAVDTMRQQIVVSERLTGITACEFKFVFNTSVNATPLIGEINILFE